MIPNDDKQFMEFQKRAANLIAEKFVVDYYSVREYHEEIEHFYEIWIKQFPYHRELELMVWRAVVKMLIDTANIKRGQ